MLMLIELTNGYFATIDDDDHHLIAGRSWRTLKAAGGHIYAACTGRKDDPCKMMLMHRIIMGAMNRCLVVDHRDNDGLNNRRSNLRCCNHGDNIKNSRRPPNATGVRNVYFRNRGVGATRFVGELIVDGIRHRKVFNTIETATEYVESLRRKLHQDFYYDPANDSRETKGRNE